MNNIPANILNQYIEGTLEPQDKLEALHPDLPDTSELLVSCRSIDYSASQIARAVEDVDVTLLGLAVTSMKLPESDHLVVELRVGSRSTDAVSASLARYGYETIYSRVPVSDEQRRQASERINELLHYLEL